MSGARLPFLARLATRYALRHRGQTARAILGLLVATAVLMTGFGMGESIAVSLEREALAQFGPVDVALRGREPFEESFAQRLALDERVRPFGVEGASSLSITGSVVNAAEGLAEAGAEVRGASAAEARALGPFRSPAGEALPELREGEAYVSERLARRVGAGAGDRLVVRVAPPGALPEADLVFTNFTGVTGSPVVSSHALEVEDDALGLGAFVQWPSQVGAVRIEARSPSGASFANESDEAPVVLLVPPPLEAGTWSVAVTGAPTAYLGTAVVAYAPAVLDAGIAEMEVVVKGVVADGGRAGVTSRPALVVPLAELQRATGMAGRANVAHYRVAGDPYEAVAALEAAIPEERREAFRVSAIKADALANAAEAGEEVAGFLVGLGGFTLVAAVLLAFALFSALVEERRPELGIGRALGLTRGEIALAMTMEGALYAAAAAVAGLLLGLLILVAFLFGVGALAPPDAPEFSLHLTPRVVITAFAIGTLLPLATIGLASLRFARLDPSRAIRGIPEDPKRRRGAGLVAAGVLVPLGLLLSLHPLARLVGAPIAAGGVAALLAGLGRPRFALLAAGAGVAHVLWSLYAFEAWPEEGGEWDPILTLARGAVLALGLAALAVASPAPYAWIASLLSRGGKGTRAPFVAIRYLVSRRRAAGLTMGMIALVVVVVTVMGTLFLLFSAQIPEDQGGYQVVGTTPLPMDALPKAFPDDLAPLIEQSDVVAQHRALRPANMTIDGRDVEFEFGLRSFSGIDEKFARANGFTLAIRAPQYATDEDAWLAVARGEAMMIPTWFDPEGGPEPGDVVELRTANGETHEYVIAATTRDSVGQNVLSFERVRAMGFPQSSTFLVRVRDPADASTVAHRLTSHYQDDGVTFVSVPEEIAAAVAGIRAVIAVFEAFLALGLFVGLAGTGFLASRAVHERMRDIGTLRALGFEEADVRRAFVFESAATAGVGLAIGLGVGVLVAHSVWWREIRDQGIPFTPPWLVVLAFGVVVLALAALAARGPAKRAAKLAPAIAVRYVE